MSTNIEAISTMLDQLELGHRRVDNRILLQFATDTYQNLDGDQVLRLVIDVMDDGAFLQVLAPMAFRLVGEHRAAAIETCLRFQWRYRLIRCEFDPSDGELRPSIHLPLLDSPLGDAQLAAVVRLLVSGCDNLYTHLAAALESGTIMALPASGLPEGMRNILDRLSQLSPDQLETLVRAVSDTAAPEDAPSPHTAPAGDVAESA